jgi:hypothetical protein
MYKNPPLPAYKLPLIPRKAHLNTLSAYHYLFLSASNNLKTI